MKPYYLDLKWEYGTIVPKLIPYKKYYIEHNTGNNEYLFGLVYNKKSLYSKTIVDNNIYDVLIKAIAMNLT